MKKLPFYVSLLVTCLWATATEAQLFSRRANGNPGQRVPELIVTVRTDSSERKRAAAAAELRDFDGNQYPEIISVLADVAKTDARASVREEAIDSLSRLRPVSQLAGQTLEWAATRDDSWKVRWQAKTALVRYNLAGYTKAPETTGPISTQEPPLLEAPRGFTPPTAVVSPSKPRDERSESRGFLSQGPLARFLGTKTPAPPAPTTPVNGAKPAPVTTPPPVVKFSEPDAAPLQTPPPLVIDVGPTVPASPAPTTPGATTPSATGGGNVTEPNFRPSVPAPPRTGFTTAVPQPESIGPPSKNNEGPALTPPM
jgi:hypothetical protein